MILFLGSIAAADVVWLNDGSVYFGAIESADASGITIKTFGETRKILQSEIVKSEKTLDNMKNMPVDILLKDGSVIKGRIQNYDEEVGILVITDLGQSTLPVSSIKEIYNPTIRELYNPKKKETGATVIKETGTPLMFNIGITGGYYIPVMGLASDFNNSYNLSIFGECNPGLIRGLSFGGEFSTILIDSNVDDNDFSIYAFQPYIQYNFLQLKDSSSFIKYFTPFVSAGVGAAYIKKKNSYDERSETDTIGNLKIGLDYAITESLAARFYTGIETILQKDKNFNRALFDAGIMYSF